MHPEDPISPREAVRSYRDLNLWKEAKILAIEVLRIADGPTLSRRRGLCDQISRSAISVPSNIAEGDERGSNRDAIRFLYIARGSAAELATQLEIAHDIGALTPTEYQSTQRRLYSVSQLLGGTIRMRQERLRQEERHP
jgi:four helix bundle protein